jgi:hypothetical protein
VFALVVFSILYRMRNVRSLQESRKSIDWSAKNPPDMTLENPPSQDVVQILTPYLLTEASTPVPLTPKGNSCDGRQSLRTIETTSAVPLMSHTRPQSAATLSAPSPPSNGAVISRVPPLVSPTASLTRDGGPDADTSQPVHLRTSGISGLTEEQARLVRDLHAHGVPAAEIATVLETMRRERDSGQSPSPLGGAPSSTGDAPPGYNF